MIDSITYLIWTRLLKYSNLFYHVDFFIIDYIRFILARMDEEADGIDIVLDPMYYPSKHGE